MATVASSIWKPKGLVGIRSLREKSGFLPTGLIGLAMIWKMNFVLMVILLRGGLGVLHRTNYGQLRQPAPPLEFPASEQGMFIDMYAQVREEEQVISPQFTRKWARCIHEEEKEAEASRGWYCFNVTTHCNGGVMIRQGLLLSTCGCTIFGHFLIVAYCPRSGLHPSWSDIIHTWKPRSAWIAHTCFKHFCFFWKMNSRMNPNYSCKQGFPMFSLASLWRTNGRNPWTRNLFCLQGTVPIGTKCLGQCLWGGEGSGSKLTMVLLYCNYTQHWPLTTSCWRTLWEPGDGSLRWEPELVSPGFTLFLDWSGMGCLCVVVGCCLGLFAFCFMVPDLFLFTRCLTMTLLAQPNDCHSCNDARSIVQKKNRLNGGLQRYITGTSILWSHVPMKY